MASDDRSEGSTSAFERAMLETIVSGTSDAVYVKDRQGRYLLFNEAASAVVGKPSDEVLGRDDTAIFPPDEAQAIMAGDRDVMDSGETRTYGEVLTDADGEMRTFLTTKGPMRDAEGTVIGLFGIARDITALRRAEDAERQKERRLQLAMNTMLEGCQIIGRDWRYVYVNEAVAQQSRLRTDDLMGADFLEMWPGIEKTELFERLRDCMENQTPHRMENEFVFPDGSVGWFDLDIQPVPEGVFILSIDFTKRRRAEDALRRREAELSMAQQIAHIGSWTYSMSGEVTGSPEMYRICGVSQDTFQANAETLLDLMHPDYRTTVEAWLEALAAGKAPPELRFDIVRPDGTVRTVSGQGAAVLDADGNLLHLAGTMQDITERSIVERELALHREHLEELVEARTRDLAEANAELDATNEELQAANASLEEAASNLTELNKNLEEATQAKSTFLANMSHELRTPLNSIIGFSDMLFRGLVGDLTEEQHKQVGMIHHSGLHLLSLINDVLDLTKIEAGAVEITLEALDPVETIRDVAETLGPLAQEKDLELQIDIPAPGVKIISDESKLLQILLNLGGNAIKFTDTGVVKIGLEYTRDTARFTVSDSGRGIPDSEVSRIFDAFAQVHQSRRARPEGTGLGLAISRQYAALLGGQIRVASKVDVGSTFTLDLPLD